MSGLTVFFYDNVDRVYIDEPDLIYTTTTNDGHLSVLETLRLIPGGQENWREPRTVVMFPPGQWREIQFDYEH